MLFSHFGLFFVPANFTNTFQAPSIKLFEPAQRRQNLNANKKILRKSNGNSGVKMRMNPVTKRPASMYVSSDLNGNHQPQISSKSRSLLPNQTLRNMTVLEKVKTPFLCQFTSRKHESAFWYVQVKLHQRKKLPTAIVVVVTTSLSMREAR